MAAHLAVFLGAKYDHYPDQEEEEEEEDEGAEREIDWELSCHSNTRRVNKCYATLARTRL